MSCIHYKFKSFLDYKTLTFDGLHISVGDLKREIQEKEKIGAQGAFDLELTNAQTKKVYKEDVELIPRNSSVTVARIPAASQKRLPKIQGDKVAEGSVTQSKIASDKGGSVSIAATMFEDQAKLANSSLTEEEKVEEMKRHSTSAYDPSKYVHRNSLMSGPPPPTYICNRCHKSGHWIKNCPQANVKRTTGIMSSELIETTADDPLAYMTPTGKYVVPIMHRDAYLRGKKERPPFLEEDTSVVSEAYEEPKPKIPPELLCGLCEDLLRDAVMILCCGDSFCDDCIRPRLMDASSNRECPHCHETGISPDSLVPNAKLRQAVQNFQNETGYSHYKRKPTQPLLKFSIPSGQPVINPTVTLAPPLQALLNRYMQPAQTSAGSTPSAGASPRQQEDSPLPLLETEKEEVKSGAVVATVPPMQMTSSQPPVTVQPGRTAGESSQSVPFVQPAVTVHRPPLAAVAPIQIQPYNALQSQQQVPPTTVQQVSLAPAGVPFHQHSNQAFVAPPGVTPPPVSSSLVSQPPPPGLTTQPQPPGVFAGDVRRSRSPKDSGTDAWDEYLARKDRKKKRDSSDSSESSSSNYSRRSRSRSPSRSRTPRRDRERRRRRRRSYTRSRTRSPPPRRRRYRTRTRSPRTPSPDWAVAAAAAAAGRQPYFGPHRIERNRRPRSPSGWYFYAGGSKRGPHHAHFLQNLAAVSGGSRTYQSHHEPYNQTMMPQGGRQFQQYSGGNRGSAGFSQVSAPVPFHSHQPPVVVNIPRADDKRKEDSSADRRQKDEEKIWMCDDREEDKKQTKSAEKIQNKPGDTVLEKKAKDSKSPSKRKPKKIGSSEKKKTKKEGETSSKEKKKKKTKKSKSSPSADSDEMPKENIAGEKKDKLPEKTPQDAQVADVSVKPDVVEDAEKKDPSLQAETATGSSQLKAPGKKRKPSTDKTDSSVRSPKKARHSNDGKEEADESKGKVSEKQIDEVEAEKTKDSFIESTSEKPRLRQAKQFGKSVDKSDRQNTEKPKEVESKRRRSSDSRKEKSEMISSKKEAEQEKPESRRRSERKKSSGDSKDKRDDRSKEIKDAVEKKQEERKEVSTETKLEERKESYEKEKKHEERKAVSEKEKKSAAVQEKEKKSGTVPEKEKKLQEDKKVAVEKEKKPEERKVISDNEKKQEERKPVSDKSKEPVEHAESKKQLQDPSASKHSKKDHRHHEKSKHKKKGRSSSKEKTAGSVQSSARKDAGGEKSLNDTPTVEPEPLWIVGRKSKSLSADDRRRSDHGDSTKAEKFEKVQIEDGDSADSKKEKKKKKKKSKERGDHKKKHKKDKEKRKSPTRSSVEETEKKVEEGQPYQHLYSDIGDAKPRPLMSFKASPPKPSLIRMQVSNPIRPVVPSSKWEEESSESDGDTGAKLQMQHPVRSVKERLGVRKDSQPLQQYQQSTKLSPETIAKAEHAILSKLRKPAGRTGTKSSSLVVTAERQDRRVSLEGDSERRVVSGADKGLSVTVTESSTFPSRSKDDRPIASRDRRRVSKVVEESQSSGLSGADTDERAGTSGNRRSSASSRPVKLKKAWKSSTDEAASKK